MSYKSESVDWSMVHERDAKRKAARRRAVSSQRKNNAALRAAKTRRGRLSGRNPTFGAKRKRKETT